MTSAKTTTGPKAGSRAAEPTVAPLGLGRIRRRVRLGGLVALTAALLAGAGAAQATAAPMMKLDIHHNETNFPPGGTAEYWFEVNNVGPTATSGAMSLTINLPSGITRNSFRTLSDESGVGWNCPGAPGSSVVTCSTGDSLVRHTVSRGLILRVNVNPSASGDRVATARLSGGGADPAPAAAGCSAGVVACASELTRISATPAGFGIVPGSWRADFYEPDGITPVRAAGSHPDAAQFDFDFNTVDSGVTTSNGLNQIKKADEPIRNIRVDLPPGFVGDPTATNTCTPAQLTAEVCPIDSQVGRADLMTTYINRSQTAQMITSPVFNLEHPKGSIADLAFVFAGEPVHIKASLDPKRNYAVTTKVSNINETLPPFHSKVTIWGVPADPSHDSERCGDPKDTFGECPAGIPEKPFLTVPFDCVATTNQMELSDYDSWENSGVFGPDLFYDLPGQFTNCAQSQALFAPTATAAPTNPRADSPTGISVEADVPQSLDPDGVATPPVKDLEITLPEGMALNPSFADGLRGCTEAEIGISHQGVPDEDPVTCPDQSRIGSVELDTPVLPTPTDFPADCPGTEPLQGSIYLAKQTDNPVNSLFAIYTIFHDCEDRGVLIKAAGSMTLDPVTGQITTTFTNLPELPFSHLSVKFRGGDRAPLVNPPTCGQKTATGTLHTWAEPQTDVAIGSSYNITQGADGGPCFADLLSRPFNPTLEAGTRDPVAATFSPFSLKMTRADGEQEPTALSVELPEGLTGKLAGVTQCSEAAIASVASEPGTGAAEKANPTCPASSRVGTVYAGSGAGAQPFFIEGSAYLAGPYDGAPLSLAIVTPAVAGGIDLGNVVLRSALRVDPRTTQITVDTKAIPTIVHGVPIHLRDIRVQVDRPNFTINPTSCNEMAVKTTTTGASGAVAENSERFQVGGCDSLGFSPKLSFAAVGGKKATKRNQHPGLDAELTYPPGYLEGGERQANIASVEVTLPKQMLLDQSSPAFATICTRPQYAAGACPASTQVGTATATSPLLDEPVSGPVYLKSSDNQLPDLAADLHGLIDIDLFGRVDQSQGRIRNTFDVVPDAPVSHFSLSIDGGKDGILVNANAGRGLCESKKRRQIDVTMEAQNGDREITHPMLKAKCPKPKKGGRGRG